MEYASIDLGAKAEFGDNRLHVIRIDPAKSKLVALLSSQLGGNGHRAGEWCKGTSSQRPLAWACSTDHKTNVGYARNGTHVNNKSWSACEVINPEILSLGLHSMEFSEDPINPFSDMGCPDVDSEPFAALLGYYRRSIKPPVRTYIINPQPYDHLITSHDRDGVTTIHGWSSEAVLKYIEHDSATDGSNMVDIVGRVRL